MLCSCCLEGYTHSAHSPVMFNSCLQSTCNQARIREEKRDDADRLFPPLPSNSLLPSPVAHIPSRASCRPRPLALTARGSPTRLTLLIVPWTWPMIRFVRYGCAPIGLKMAPFNWSCGTASCPPSTTASHINGFRCASAQDFDQ